MRIPLAMRLSRALAFSLLLLPAFSLAQDAAPDDEVQRGPGLELALFGSPTAFAGRPFSLTGIAYEVRELATLQRLPGAQVEVSLLEPNATDANDRPPIARGTAIANANGLFSLQMAIPDRETGQVLLRVRLSHQGMGERIFESLQTIRTVSDVLARTDRALYEPNETAHVWVRAFDSLNHAPIGNATVHLECTDPSNRVIGTVERRTAESGVFTADFALPPTAIQGTYAVRGTADFRTHRRSIDLSFEVGRRTVERLRINAELDQKVVRPGAMLSGTVHVRSAAGAPVRNTNVDVKLAGQDTATPFQTDQNGDATFRIRAPEFLSGDVRNEQVIFEVRHPAYGALSTQLGFRVARTPYVVDAVALNGVAILEVDSFVYVGVTTAAGEIPPAGLAVTVSGSAVRSGSFRGITDAHGLLEVPVRISPGAAARNEEESAGCEFDLATQFSVTIEGERPMTTRTSVCTSRDGDLSLALDKVVIAPGNDVRFHVERRPRVAGRAIHVEVRDMNDLVVAASWLSASDSDGVVRIPEHVQGVLTAMASALAPDNTLADIHEPSPPLGGAVTSVYFVAKPVDAFALSIQTPTDPSGIRSNADITIRTGTHVENGYAAVLVRDEAASDGEREWSHSWIRELLDESLLAPNSPANDRFLRVSLAAMTEAPRAVAGVPPHVPYPWDQDSEEDMRRPPGIASNGVLFDPITNRAEYLRGSVGLIMSAIERAIASIGADPEAGRGLVVRTGNRTQFDPRIVDTLVDLGELESESAVTLGDTRATIAMIEHADSSFTFDRVARRIARKRLVSLMTAMLHFTNPDDSNAARVANVEPPERWLSKMLDLGRIEADGLVDPWGHAFMFRRAANGTPRFVLSERAPTFELVSAGPDGVAGNADDVRDPFERVVPAETTYAVESGEDELMRTLASVSASTEVLDRMLQAYSSFGMQAEEERRRGIVTASASELAMDDAVGEVFGQHGGEGEGTIGLGRIGTVGHGSGSGNGYGSGAGGFRGRVAMGMATAAPMIQENMMVAGTVARPDVLLLAAMRGRIGSGAMGEMGEAIRERFPATLFFAGDVHLDASGSTSVRLETADALTTYSVEAIAWSRSGWMTSARAELRVDQPASVDAPVPSTARTGDELRIPVRVQNHTRNAMRVRVEIASEGDLGISEVAPHALEVPANDAAVVVVPVTAARAGIGALVVRAFAESGQSVLDAVRRPMQILLDAQPVHVRHEAFFRGSDEFTLRVPADATARGRSQIRVRYGDSLFGNLMAGSEREFAAGEAWAYRVAGRTIPDAVRLAALSATAPEVQNCSGGVPEQVAFLSVAYDSPTISDTEMLRVLECVNNRLPTETDFNALEFAQRSVRAVDLARALVTLAPTTRVLGARPNVRSDFERLIARVRALVEGEISLEQNAPEAWTHVALGLALLSPDNPLARELLRRSERYIVRYGDRMLLDSDLLVGSSPASLLPTARLALLLSLFGRDADAVACMRILVRAAYPDPWSATVAHAAAMTLAGTTTTESVQVEIDGRPTTLEAADGSWLASTPALQTPGEHRIRMRGTPGAAALVLIDVDYGRPWNATDRVALLEASLDGEVGPRDTRSGLRLTVRNHGARTANAPVVEIDLPAGSELDERTMERLSSLTASPPYRDRDALHLRLRRLAPGAFVRIPLSVRFSVAGELRGLGAVVSDESLEVDASGTRPRHAVPSRVVNIADQGNAPSEAEAEESPPPPPPPPLPRPLVRPLGPVAEVMP